MAGRRHHKGGHYNEGRRAVDGPEAGVIYGIHPVAELMAADQSRVIRLHFLDGARGAVQNLITDARAARIPFDIIHRSRLDEMAGTTKHQGVVAQVSAMPYLTLDELIDRVADGGKPGLLIALDEVEDPRNLGAVMRTAEAAGADGIIVPKRRSAPATDLVAKVSAGAFLHLPLARVENMAQGLEKLKKAGYWVYGLAAEGDVNVADADYKDATVLVLGAEGKGLRPLVARHCDMRISIPLKGKTPSLNV